MYILNKYICLSVGLLQAVKEICKQKNSRDLTKKEVWRLCSMLCCFLLLHLHILPFFCCLAALGSFIGETK